MVVERIRATIDRVSGTTEKFAKFEELEHTADVGLRVRGRSFAELCENAAEGMFGLIGKAAFDAAEIQTRRVELGYDGLANGLHAWLQSLLLAFSMDGFFVTGATVESSDGRLVGTLRGSRFDLSRHEFHTELKAVTRHGLRVTRHGDGFEAEVIFDV